MYHQVHRTYKSVGTWSPRILVHIIEILYTYYRKKHVLWTIVVIKNTITLLILYFYQNLQNNV